MTPTGKGENRTAQSNVDRPDELKPSGEECVTAHARDGHAAVLERLPERLEHGAGGLRELVHEEHSEVPQCPVS
jgi:hypothetical protein